MPASDLSFTKKQTSSQESIVYAIWVNLVSNWEYNILHAKSYLILSGK